MAPLTRSLIHINNINSKKRFLSTTSKLFASPSNSGPISNSFLAQKEQVANSNLGNADVQADFYRSLIAADYPQVVISRFETPNIAQNSECIKLYADALDSVGSHQAAKAARSNINRGSIPQNPMMMGSLGMTGTANSPVHVVISESKTTLLLNTIKWLLPLVLIGYVGFAVWGALGEIGIMKSEVDNKKIEVATSDVRFDDVKGCDEAKEELEEIVEFLKDPGKFTGLGGKLPKGVLLTGPPGTGKTLLARAVAGEAEVPFLSMPGSEFDELYVGVGAKRVRELFTQAKESSPAIIFIDEIDAVGGKRNSRDPSYVKQTLNQLLVELDGFSPTSGIIIIGATNFPESLDPALTRPGRFDKSVDVSLPDVVGRTEILKLYLSKVETSPNVNPSLIARGTPGLSGADLNNLVNQAAVYASQQNALAVDLEHLEWAKDKVLMGAARKTMIMTEEERMATAFHEAGHAIMSLFTPLAQPLYKATVLPRGRALGITFTLPERDQWDQTRKQLLAELDVLMGGKAAEEVVYGKDDTTAGCGSDISRATKIAKNMVIRYGMSDNLGPVQLADDWTNWSSSIKEAADKEALEILKASEDRARKLLRDKKLEFERLAYALLEYETLNLEEIQKVCRGEPLDKMKLETNTILKLPHKRKILDFGNEISKDDKKLVVTANKENESNENTSTPPKGDSSARL